VIAEAEQANVIREHPDIAERLRQQLTAAGAKLPPAQRPAPGKKASKEVAKKNRP
jgi:hypothetical protein